MSDKKKMISKNQNLLQCCENKSEAQSLFLVVFDSTGSYKSLDS